MPASGAALELRRPPVLLRINSAAQNAQNIRLVLILYNMTMYESIDGCGIKWM